MDNRLEELLAKVAAWQAKVVAATPPDGFTDGVKCDLCGRPVANKAALDWYQSDDIGEDELAPWDAALCFGMCDEKSQDTDPPKTGAMLFLALEVLRLRALAQP